MVWFGAADACCIAVRSVKLALVAVTASSVRYNRAMFAALALEFPTPTYIRVNPPVIGVTANDARSVFSVALRAFFICVQLAPLSFERHTPPPELGGQMLLAGNGAA